MSGMLLLLIHSCAYAQEEEDLYCKTKNEEGTCTECFKTCTLMEYGNCDINPMCLNVKDLKCIKCMKGYVLASSGHCVRDGYCTEVGEDGKCTKCREGSYLNGETCYPIENCKKVEGDMCVECINNNYILNDGKCDDNSECYS